MPVVGERVAQVVKSSQRPGNELLGSSGWRPVAQAASGWRTSCRRRQRLMKEWSGLVVERSSSPLSHGGPISEGLEGRRGDPLHSSSQPRESFLRRTRGSGRTNQGSQ